MFELRQLGVRNRNEEGMGFEEVLIGDKRLAYFTLKQNLIYPTINR